MSDYKLDPNKNIDVSEILKDLENYRPRRRGWTWREPAPGLKMGPLVYQDCSKPLQDSVPLPPAHYFDDIDPQPMQMCIRDRCRKASWSGFRPSHNKG